MAVVGIIKVLMFLCIFLQMFGILLILIGSMWENRSTQQTALCCCDSNDVKCACVQSLRSASVTVLYVFGGKE